MNKIGIIFGMENTFPPALVEKINSMRVDSVSAEFVKVGGVKMADPSGYRVIIDRISQDIPFYRAFLKNAALAGRSSSTIHSGGPRTTSFSITRWRVSSAWLFRRP